MAGALELTPGKRSAEAHGRGVTVALEMGANFLLPYAVYRLAEGPLGATHALMAASAPPILWSLGVFLRQRRIDAISLVVLAGLALSLLAFAGGGGVRFLQLRENLAAGVVGVAFLTSAAIGRPLIYALALARVRRGSAEGAQAFAALAADARLRRAMTIATLAWGFGLVAVCAINAALVFAVSIDRYLLLSGPIAYGALAALTAWTFWYVRREKRSAEARAAEAR